jgi:hypothetical protein
MSTDKIKNDIECLRDSLVSLKKTLEKLLTAENEKTKALETGDVCKLTTLINSEQALVMESSAAEKRREQVCERLGVKSMTEFYDRYPTYKEHIAPVHSELLNYAALLKKAGALNNRLLDTRLSVIKLMNSQLGIYTENTQYGKNAGLTNHIR